MIKKIIRFILAVLVAPIYIPFWAISVIVTSTYEVLSDYPDWDTWIEYHFVCGFKWYLFK